MTMTAATGASTKELSRRTGHSTPSASLRYRHASQDRDKAITHALSTLVTAGVVAPEAGHSRRSQTNRARQRDGRGQKGS